MGLYFNPGNESFCKDSGSEIYIDKTGLIIELNKSIGTSQNCIAVSHARRFGKSQAAGMIDAYYSMGSDSEELFSGFEVAGSADYKKHLNKYHVIHLDISSFTDFYTENLLDKITCKIYEEIHQVYPNVISADNTITAILWDVYNKTKIPFVIIIDEWDFLIRNQSDNTELVHRYLQFLHALFKSEESKKFLALGYITGILPIKKIKDESALNNFDEYTMISCGALTRYYGFTEEEVISLCNEYDLEFDSVKQWYDGYLINGMHMYNPNSVVMAIRRRDLASYWKNTSNYETITKYILMNFDGLKDDIIDILEGKKVRVNVGKFQNDLSEIKSKDDAITALIHLGYLGYDAPKKKAYMPNYEVAEAYQSALETSGWNEIAAILGNCEELLDATIEMDEKRVAALLEIAHENNTSEKEYNDENSLSCAITMAYFTAPAYYNVVREFPSGKGFADMVMIPRRSSGGRPAIVIELKYDKSVDGAIRQIKEKRYTGALAGFDGKILLVGINYDKHSKVHECKIEAFGGIL